MVLITLQSFSFEYSREPVLRQVDTTILSGVKYALVGANGAGKTTLLAALAGRLTPSEGERQVVGATSIQLLHQDAALDPAAITSPRAMRLLDAVSATAFSAELQLQAELREVTRALAGEPSREDAEPHGGEQERLVQRQGWLQAEFERRGGYTMQSRLEATLLGVGLAEAMWDQPLERLSGGERRRAALAAILLSEADVLLLDEPTNHLDLQACEWLEGFLQRYRGAVVLVSHDREFLDRITEQTLHLDRGEVTAYSGNYSFFRRAYQQRLEQDRLAYERQRERIRRTEDYIQRNLAGQKTKQAQSRRKQLAKEVRLLKPPSDPSAYRINLQPARRSGGMVLEADQLSKGYRGRILFQGLDLRLSRGERLGIIGPNGCGKSTLLKILSGRVTPDTGSVRRGHNVDLGLYDQELQSVSNHLTPLAEMAAVDPTATVSELRSFLGAFGFSADLVERPVAKLSGGERGRLALLRLIKEGHNTLLLDEPTNHLDIRAREALETALADFAGTLVVVSHDRRFLDKIIGRLLVFATAGQVAQHLGTYAEYRARRERLRAENEERRAEAPAVQMTGATGRTTRRPATKTADTQAERGADQTTRGSSGQLSKNEQARRQQWIAQAEVEIAELEQEREQLLEAMKEASLTVQARTELGHRCTEVDGLIAEKLRQWERWHLEIEGMPSTDDPAGNDVAGDAVAEDGQQDSQGGP